MTKTKEELEKEIKTELNSKKNDFFKTVVTDTITATNKIVEKTKDKKIKEEIAKSLKELSSITNDIPDIVVKIGNNNGNLNKEGIKGQNNNPAKTSEKTDSRREKIEEKILEEHTKFIKEINKKCKEIRGSKDIQRVKKELLELLNIIRKKYLHDAIINRFNTQDTDTIEILKNKIKKQNFQDLLKAEFAEIQGIIDNEKNNLKERCKKITVGLINDNQDNKFLQKHKDTLVQNFYDSEPKIDFDSIAKIFTELKSAVTKEKKEYFNNVEKYFKNYLIFVKLSTININTIKDLYTIKEKQTNVQLNHLIRQTDLRVIKKFIKEYETYTDTVFVFIRED